MMTIHLYRNLGVTDAHEYRLCAMSESIPAPVGGMWVHIGSFNDVEQAIETLKSYLNLETTR